MDPNVSLVSSAQGGIWDRLVEGRGKVLYEEVIPSPQAMKEVVDKALELLKTIPDGKIDQAVTFLKNTVDGESLSENKIIDTIVALVTGPFELKVFDNPEVVKNLKQAAIQKQISRLAGDAKVKKIMKAIALTMPETPEITCINKVDSPEGKEFALTMLRKFKLAPQATFKEKLAKVWEAIKSFFQKLFCCCKKKEKEEKVGVNDNAEPVGGVVFDPAASVRDRDKYVVAFDEEAELSL
jgi:hypothetical protein